MLHHCSGLLRNRRISLPTKSSKKFSADAPNAMNRILVQHKLVIQQEQIEEAA
uniref:Uncharacterized protein n=1 Tax=Aegilops tauschii subsp. strangulata TaxID=200361 RepID=A0A453BTC8_AEGTS